MPLLDITIPGWVGQAITIFASIGGGALMVPLFQRLFPTAKEKAGTNKERADFVKIYADAEMLHFRLTDEVKRLVDIESKKFSSILMTREVEHRKAKNEYIERIAELEQHLTEANEKIQDLEKRIYELERK